jgi:hypothetical protein
MAEEWRWLGSRGARARGWAGGRGARVRALQPRAGAPAVGRGGRGDHEGDCGQVAGRSPAQRDELETEDLPIAATGLAGAPSKQRVHWTEREDAIIVAGKSLGNTWQEICSKLPGRTMGVMRQRWERNLRHSAADRAARGAPAALARGAAAADRRAAQQHAALAPHPHRPAARHAPCLRYAYDVPRAPAPQRGAERAEKEERFAEESFP